jgi:hypothetical protein
MRALFSACLIFATAGFVAPRAASAGNKSGQSKLERAMQRLAPPRPLYLPFSNRPLAPWPQSVRAQSEARSVAEKLRYGFDGSPPTRASKPYDEAYAKLYAAQEKLIFSGPGLPGDLLRMTVAKLSLEETLRAPAKWVRKADRSMAADALLVLRAATQNAPDSVVDAARGLLAQFPVPRR